MSADRDALQDLNSAQASAVACTDGPLLVIAGAGSGKTRVITRRIAHLIEIGVAPESILAVTFTNKAAREMRERVESLVGPTPTILSTFHSFAARFLRGQADRIGLDARFTLFDRSDSEAAVKAVLKRLKLDSSMWSPSGIMAFVGSAKSEMRDCQDALRDADTNWEHEAARVYEAYEELLRRNNALDFDDLLFRTVQALTDDPSLREALNDRFRYVLVDEYQDVNQVQYRLVRHFGDAHRNVCVTGDPDQCIYAWRGARPQYMLEFEQDFPGAVVVRLEQNYRSTNRILRSASQVIRFNSQHGDKELFSDLGEGERIRMCRLPDEIDESLAVVERIHELRHAGARYSEIAVFYRLNSLSLPVERALMSNNIAYQVLHGLEFFKRKEVKDLLAYVRCLFNIDDEISLARIINTPTRGIGKKTIDTLAAAASARGIPLGRLLADGVPADVGLSARATAAVDRFAAMMRELRPVDPENAPAAPILREITRVTSYEDFHAKRSKKAGLDPHGNIHQLIAFAADHDRGENDRGVAGFLEDVSLYTDVDAWEEDADKVALMTVHSAKGLEFPHVIIIGLDQDIFPHMGPSRDQDIEEERRLFYVGMTRAMQSLTLLTTDTRMRFGSRSHQRPSLFLGELPPDDIDVLDDGGGDRGTEDSGIEYEMEDDFRVSRGARVMHGKFGTGTVQSVRGRGLDARIVVDFDGVGRKKLVLRYAGLTLADESL